MRLEKSVLLASALLATLTSAQGAEIKRYFGNPRHRILQSVELPPGARILMLSGTVADPLPGKTGEQIGDYGNTQTQAASAFRKIQAALRERGYQLRDLVKLTVFLVGDPRLGGELDFDGFTAAFDQFFNVSGNPNSVTRSTVQVAALAEPPLLVEIEATAARMPQSVNEK